MVMHHKNYSNKHNKVLHRAAIPLRSIAAGELGRLLYLDIFFNKYSFNRLFTTLWNTVWFNLGV
jgi:hypothetical protein